jgi:outer membrane protein insertion porin family
MKKSLLFKQVGVGLAVSMLAALPVYAETNTTVSQPIATNRKGGVIRQEPSQNIDNNAQKPMENMGTVGSAPAPSVSTQVKPYVGQVVTKVSITGNEKIKTEDILAAVKTKPGMKLTEDEVNKDLQSIYELGWFYDMVPQFTAVPEGVQLSYHVMENPVYKRLKVYGNTKMKDVKVDLILNIPQDQIINVKDVNAKIQQLEAAYSKEGYILARVTDMKMQPDGTLEVYINEGLVQGFKVKGNVKTKDYVILREMKIKKGEPFNSKDARRSMQKIYNLGFFEDVNVKLNPGTDPNSVEVEVDVVETNTGTFGIGAGYSDADGFVGMISVGDKNFRGTGDSISMSWEFGGVDNKNYSLTYTKPWLDKKETSATISLYDLTNSYADYNRDADEIARYDKRRIGQELTFSRKTNNEFISNYLTLKNRRDSYSGMTDGYENTSSYDQYYEDSYNQKYYDQYKTWTTAEDRRKENFGSTRSITFARVLDSRDNVYDPHEGKRNSYSLEWAGLGGDFRFTKLSVDYRYYLRSMKNNVWAFDFAAGYAWGDMPLSQRFTMGGSDTLRGYKDDQFRGNSMLKGTIEYRMPIIEKVQGVLFVDSGYAWDKRDETAFDLGLIKAGYGVGLRVNSPLGPIKLDYGFGSNGGRFHFSFGGQF